MNTGKVETESPDHEDYGEHDEEIWPRADIPESFADLPPGAREFRRGPHVLAVDERERDYDPRKGEPVDEEHRARPGDCDKKPR